VKKKNEGHIVSKNFDCEFDGDDDGLKEAKVDEVGTKIDGSESNKAATSTNKDAEEAVDSQGETAQGNEKL